MPHLFPTWHSAIQLPKEMISLPSLDSSHSWRLTLPSVVPPTDHQGETAPFLFSSLTPGRETICHFLQSTKDIFLFLPHPSRGLKNKKCCSQSVSRNNSTQSKPNRVWGKGNTQIAMPSYFIRIQRTLHTHNHGAFFYFEGKNI